MVYNSVMIAHVIALSTSGGALHLLHEFTAMLAVMVYNAVIM